MPDRRVTTQQKEAVAKRARGCCEYCRSQARFAMQSFSIEHIVPRSQGGKTTLDNLALSCQGCNNHKYNKIEAPDPVSGKAAKLYHPRKQAWKEHFAWGDGGLPPKQWTPKMSKQYTEKGGQNGKTEISDIHERIQTRGTKLVGSE